MVALFEEDKVTFGPSYLMIWICLTYLMFTKVLSSWKRTKLLSEVTTYSSGVNPSTLKGNLMTSTSKKIEERKMEWVLRIIFLTRAPKGTSMHVSLPYFNPSEYGKWRKGREQICLDDCDGKKGRLLQNMPKWYIDYFKLSYF